MQRAQRVSALYLPHSTFLVSWQQFSCPFPPPHRLPLLPFVSAAAFFACHLTVCWHFYKIHVRVCATFVSSLCSPPLLTPLFACFTVFAAGQLNCLAFHSFSLFFFFCPPLSLCLFSTIFTLLAKRFSHWLCIFWVSKCLRFNLSIWSALNVRYTSIPVFRFFALHNPHTHLSPRLPKRWSGFRAIKPVLKYLNILLTTINHLNWNIWMQPMLHRELWGIEINF